MDLFEPNMKANIPFLLFVVPARDLVWDGDCEVLATGGICSLGSA